MPAPAVNLVATFASHQSPLVSVGVVEIESAVPPSYSSELSLSEGRICSVTKFLLVYTQISPAISIDLVAMANESIFG
jgi:hypothetical protein